MQSKLASSTRVRKAHFTARIFFQTARNQDQQQTYDYKLEKERIGCRIASSRVWSCDAHFLLGKTVRNERKAETGAGGKCRKGTKMTVLGKQQVSVKTTIGVTQRTDG